MRPLDFGKKLIEVRTLKGLTQSDVAEQCNVTVRTIQRIESGVVQPRAATIKIISTALGFDFFETPNTGYDDNKSQISKIDNHTLLWYFKDLFNLKTNTMKKISILSVSTFLIIFLFTNIFNAEAQSKNVKKQASLSIERNTDNSLKRVEVAFTYNLTIDSLVRIKQELQENYIFIKYSKLEFDIYGHLTSFELSVVCSDGGHSGAVSIVKQDRFSQSRYGFYRDYSADAASPFGTGSLADK